MRLGLIITGPAAAIALAGCATGMSEDECLTADWRALGERDGAYGEEPEKFNERAARCEKFAIVADLASYKQGRDRGLESYCTPQSGYETGSRGGIYRNVCPPETEAAFLAEYDIGRQLYILNKDYDDAVAAYEAAVNGIDSNRYDLKRARDRYNENTLTDEDRAKVRDEMRDHRRQLEQLENDLPLLEVDIDRARDRLDDYRAFLERQGR